MELKEVFEPVLSFIRNLQKKDKEMASKQAAKDRLKLVLMQDRASVSPDFFELMKQEIIDVIKKYIEIDEESLEVQLTRGIEAGLEGPALYANIPIKNVKPVAPQGENIEEIESMTEERAEELAEQILNQIENAGGTDIGEKLKKEENIVGGNVNIDMPKTDETLKIDIEPVAGDVNIDTNETKSQPKIDEKTKKSTTTKKTTTAKKSTSKTGTKKTTTTKTKKETKK